MKIVTTNHFPAGSGSATYGAGIEKALRQAGHNVHGIWITNKSLEYPWPNSTTIVYPLPWNKFPVFSTHTRSSRTFQSMSPSAIAAYRNTCFNTVYKVCDRKQPDLIVPGHLWTFSAAATQWGLENGVPVFPIIHGTALNKGRINCANTAFMEDHIKSIEYATRIIAISPFAKKQFEAVYPQHTHKVVVIMNAVDTDTYRILENLNHAKTRSKYGLPGYGNIITSVGKFSEHKGFDTLIEGFAIYAKADQDAQLVIVGGGNPELKAKLVDLTKQLGIKHRVHFLGPKKPHEVTQILNISNATAFPTIQEPFGLVALEAVACGNMVIVSDDGGFKNFIIHGINGFHIPPRDPQALANMIPIAIQANANRHNSYQIAQAAAQQHGWNNYVTQLMNLYQSV